MSELEQKLTDAAATPAEVAHEFGTDFLPGVEPAVATMAPASGSTFGDASAPLVVPEKTEPDNPVDERPVQPTIVFDTAPETEKRKRKRSTREIIRDRRHTC